MGERKLEKVSKSERVRERERARELDGDIAQERDSKSKRALESTRERVRERERVARELSLLSLPGSLCLRERMCLSGPSVTLHVGTWELCAGYTEKLASWTGCRGQKRAEGKS